MRNKRLYMTAVLLTASVLLFAGCGSKAEPASAQPASAQPASEEPASEEAGEEMGDTSENGYPIDQTSGTGDTSGEIVEAEKPVEQDGNGSNVGGMDFGRDEEEVQAEITENEDTIESTGYEIIPMDDTTFYGLQTANLRGGPGTQYDKVGSLAYAQQITVNGKVEDGDKVWLVLKTEDGSTQMVSSSLVSTTKPSTNTGNSGNTGNTGSTNGGSGSTGGGGTSGGSSSSGGDGSVGFDDPNGAFSDIFEAGGLGDTDIHWDIE